MSKPRRDVQWLDGIRGLASFTVVLTHLTRAFDDKLFFASDTPDDSPRFLQWPFIRLLFQGNVGVAIFAMLTGYVCALKPLRLARNGNQEGALSTIAKGTFRRIPRLVLPATIALIIAWLLGQFGGLKAASRCDATYLHETTPTPDPSLTVELSRLWRNFLNTWSGGRTEYDDHQWTLLPLLEGSLMAFLMTAALVYAQFRWRIVIYLLAMAYWWQINIPDSETFRQMVIWGVLLSDIGQSQYCQQLFARHQKCGVAVATPLILVGLYLASFPKFAATADFAPWSRRLIWLGDALFPYGTDYSKRFNALGIQLAALGLQISPKAQELMVNRVFLLLGKHSFAVYLIHGTLMRSLLTWALWGIHGTPWEVVIKDDGTEEQPPWLELRFHGVALLLIIGLWLCCVYYCAFLWTKYVDSLCGRITQRLEDLCFSEPATKERPQISQV